MPHLPPFKRYLVASGVAHLALLLLLLVLAPLVRMPGRQPPIAVVMVELPMGTSEAIGLGVHETKHLPEAPVPTTPPEPPAPPPAPRAPAMVEPKPPRPEAKPQPKPPAQLSPAEQKMQDALAKVDAEITNRYKPPAMAQTTSEGSKYGTSSQPLKTLPPEAELMRYKAMVRARILREWITPAGVKDLPPNVRPRAVISVRIGPDGQITSTAMATRSSNPSYDASAMRAVQRASPLPAPPAGVRDEALTKGFTVEFVVR